MSDFIINLKETCMKKITISLMAAFVAFCSISAMAADVGVVNMQKIFTTSSEVKEINANLKSQFSARKTSIVEMAQKLQAEVKKYEKNQSVMNKKSLAKVQKDISQKSLQLRQAQSKFQQDFMAAQNKKMSRLIAKVKSATKKVAAKKGLELVIPSNVVLYSRNTLDITSNVLSAM
jgi:outer membrane protein